MHLRAQDCQKSVGLTLPPPHFTDKNQGSQALALDHPASVKAKWFHFSNLLPQNVFPSRQASHRKIISTCKEFTMEIESLKQPGSQDFQMIFTRLSVNKQLPRYYS